MQVARAVPSNHSRPMSADDIQKAKMRAVFMQNKYGKADTSNSENRLRKTEDNHVPSPSETSNMLSASRAHQLPPMEKDGGTKASISTTNIRPNKSETLVIPRPNTTSQERLLEKLKCSQIPWQTPPGTFVFVSLHLFLFLFVELFLPRREGGAFTDLQSSFALLWPMGLFNKIRWFSKNLWQLS